MFKNQQLSSSCNKYERIALCSTDLHGNVRALRYMLDHPLVFRDNTIHLEKRQKPFQPYRKVRYEEAASKCYK